MGLFKPEDWTAQWITVSKWFMPPKYRPKGLELGPKGGWADVDLGASLPINSIKLYPLNPGDFPTRFTIEGSDNLQFLNPKILVDRSAPGSFSPCWAFSRIRPAPASKNLFSLLNPTWQPA
jgi:hypothetical protein